MSQNWVYLGESENSPKGVKFSPLPSSSRSEATRGGPHARLGRIPDLPMVQLLHLQDYLSLRVTPHWLILGG